MIFYKMKNSKIVVFVVGFFPESSMDTSCFLS